MTKIDIISGFLGAGKTTLIKKLLTEAFVGEKVVLIENEFGEIGIDGGFLQDAGIEITEMNSGCICCSLVGDFNKALKQVLADYAPDRIVIEPSGVGKLSDVIRAVQDVESDDAKLNSFTAVADAGKCKMYMKNFGEFYNDQIEHAGAIILSRTDSMSDEKLTQCVKLLREHNPDSVIVTSPWDKLDGKMILDAMEKSDTLTSLLDELEHDHKHHHDHDEHCGCGCHDHELEHDHKHHHDHDEHCGCGCHDHEHEHHHEHHHEHDEHCGCGCHDHEHEHHHEHHHEHDEHCGCGCHDHEHEHHHEHHHEHDEHCGCGCHDHEHEHHHEHHDEHCGCGCHDHEHEHHHEHHHEHDEHCGCGCHDHGHHHADDVFTSWGTETPIKYTKEEIEVALDELENESLYGMILRAKGIVAADDGRFIHFDYVPGEGDVRYGSAAIIGRLCVIGAELNTAEIEKLFKISK